MQWPCIQGISTQWPCIQGISGNFCLPDSYNFFLFFPSFLSFFFCFVFWRSLSNMNWHGSWTINKWLKESVCMAHKKFLKNPHKMMHVHRARCTKKLSHAFRRRRKGTKTQPTDSGLSCWLVCHVHVTREYVQRMAYLRTSFVFPGLLHLMLAFVQPGAIMWTGEWRINTRTPSVCLRWGSTDVVMIYHRARTPRVSSYMQRASSRQSVPNPGDCCTTFEVLLFRPPGLGA